MFWLKNGASSEGVRDLGGEARLMCDASQTLHSMSLHVSKDYFE